MADYKKLYFSLFNDISDIINSLEKDVKALKTAQISAEEMYISQAENKKEQDE